MAECLYLTTDELALRWHKSPRTLANQRSAGISPVAYIRVGGRILYPLCDVLAHEEKSRVEVAA